ncbi:alpha-amylase family protein [Pseudosporangium ferrugineum]|uniref:Cyclomaltodextrinase n=1 Tax=Pseudosporangium ferrugineum TaxID=439699 RepID=A0A2T0S8A4_9ACTN|nr:alpha-amylase family protein [Pseudosporangium ferrugineum]PRY29650.1 cyclomaltodextrinase [Pseudosporangium ferrugineum]
MTEAAWVEHAVWWQVYPLGFAGAYPEHDNGGLRRLDAWLDYAIELGASGLLLGPVFASETHGYDTVDHFRIDPRLGGDDDFDALVGAAHERGLRVVLDGVFNHVGRGHPAFQDYLAHGDDSARARWFRVRGRGTDHPELVTFEGHDALVTLNHAEPAVADYVADVMTHWLRRGADGWRLDAAYAVPPGFWAKVLPRVRAEFPEAYVFGEVIHGDYPTIVGMSTLDSVTQYELWKAIWSSLESANFFELSWALERHNGFLDTFVPQTFVGNHDVTRLASRLSEERHVPLAVAVLLTVGGTPSIYSGDEQGFRGVKEDRAGGDDAVRPPFPAGPAELAPYGRPLYRVHQELIGLRRRNAWLHRARTRTLHLTNEQFVYEAYADGRSLVIALNAAKEPATVPAPGGGTVELAPASWSVLTP